jgi:hypothetical protein
MISSEKGTIPHPSASLLRAFRNVVLPTLEQNPWPQIVVAQPDGTGLLLPVGVETTPRKRLGRPATRRNQGLWDRASMMKTYWPEDALHEFYVSKMVFVVDGWAGIRRADCALRCPSGTGIFLPPGTPHTTGHTSHFETIPHGRHPCRLLSL